jgi:hypothetical protein
MKRYHRYPRGPRSCSSFVVSGRHHLIDPIRPTRGHTAISPHSGLYAVPSLCGSAEATRERFRTFAVHSFLTCRPLRPRGVQTSQHPISMPTGSSPQANRLDTPDIPQSVSRGALLSRLHWFTTATACQIARLPSTDLTGIIPATGGFYIQAFNGSVSLTIAEYNYDIDWTPMSAGLTPAGMAASLAALACFQQAAMIDGRF